MRKSIDIIFLVLVLGLFIYLVKTPYYPCDTPETYKIGSIDPKFGLKNTDVLKDIDTATNILDKAYGKSLFSYATSSGEIRVNFVYDERTQLDLQVNSQKNQLDAKNQELQKQIESYEADVKVLEQKFADLNATIEKYNSQGGAPPDVYDSLISQAKNLQQQGAALNQRARQLNLATRDYNSQVGSLNNDVNKFNSELVQKPEEGFWNGADKTITIYFANDKNTLIHTLAHEFGHALGMQHVKDPKALMYAETSSYLSFTNDDRQELSRACASIPLFNHVSYVLREKVNQKEFMRQMFK